MEQFQSALAASRQKRLPMAAIPFTFASDQLAGIRCVSFCVPVARQANVHKVARPVERCCRSRLQTKPRQARPGKIRILYTISGIRARRGSREPYAQPPLKDCLGKVPFRAATERGRLASGHSQCDPVQEAVAQPDHFTQRVFSSRMGAGRDISHRSLTRPRERC